MNQPDAAARHWLTSGAPCASRLINIPTGLGKTAAVVLAWLWNRLAPEISNQKSPLAAATRLLPAHADAGGADAGQRLGKRDWDIHPERPAILIGTQDILLSRALNRGYGGRSRPAATSVIISRSPFSSVT